MKDLLSRAAIITLFTLLSVNLLVDFMQTGHVTGLLLLASESLVVVLTVLRRRARLVDHSVAAAVMTTLSVAGPPLMRAGAALPIASDAVTAIISAIGLSLVWSARSRLAVALAWCRPTAASSCADRTTWFGIRSTRATSSRTSAS